MKILILLIAILATAACKDIDTVRPVCSTNSPVQLENFCRDTDEAANSQLSKEKGRKIDTLNLSKSRLKNLPDLSSYNIKVLILSYNELDTIPLSHLPKNLDALICSHNRIRNFRSYTYLDGDNRYKNSDLNLRYLDLSDNQLYSFSYTVRDRKNGLSSSRLKTVNISNNDLDYVSLNCANVDYLDISNNKRLSNIFDFEINTIKVVKRDNILNNETLLRRRFPDSGKDH
jgi:hypothetical protein